MKKTELRDGLRGHAGRALPYITRLIGLLPLITPAALASFGAVAMVFLLLDQFRSEFVWPLGLLAALIASAVVVRFVPDDRPGSKKEQVICDILIVVGVLAWVGFNGVYTSQHVLTNRDPATYAVAAQWLTKQDNLKIGFPEVFHDVEGIATDSGGFREEDGNIYAQGQHLLPAFLGLGARIVGNHYLNLNVLFGGTALLAMYALGRMLARPRWALLVTAAFSASLPLIYFSRDTYTEPLMATFVFGSLALLWHAQQVRKWPLWLLAGIVAGAAALTRIDAYLVFIGLAGFLTIFVALAKQREERKQTLFYSGIFAAGATVVSLISWLDITQLSPLYYTAEYGNFMLQIFALVSVVIIGGLVIWLAWRYRRLLERFDRITRHWRPFAFMALVLAVVVLLASRPLWYVSTYDPADQNWLVALLQQEAGDPVEPRRYAELTVQWVGWYLGPIIATLGVIGMAMVAARASIDRKLLLLPGLFVIAATAALYMIRPKVTPDQIWAVRRLLPVVLPGVAIYGVVVLDWFYAQYLEKVKFKHIFIAIISAALIIGPLLVSRPFLTTRDTMVLAVIETTCEHLPENAAVLWVGTGQITALQPTQAFCDIPAAGYHHLGQEEPHRPTQQALAAFAERSQTRGLVPVVALYSSDVNLLDMEEDDLFRTGVVGYKEMEQTLTRPPERSIQRYISPLLGEVQIDGRIQALFSDEL